MDAAIYGHGGPICVGGCWLDVVLERARSGSLRRVQLCDGQAPEQAKCIWHIALRLWSSPEGDGPPEGLVLWDPVV